MPLYEYEVEQTKQRFEVLHSHTRAVANWGDLAEILGISNAEIAPESPVKRIIGGRVFVNGNLSDLSKGKVVESSARNQAPVCCGGGCSK